MVQVYLRLFSRNFSDIKKMGKNFVFGCVLVFSIIFVFHAKSSIIINHLIGSNDIA